MTNLWKTIVRLTSWISLVFGVMLFPFVEGLGAQETPLQAVRIGVLAKRGPKRALSKWGPTAKYLTERISNYSFSILPLRYDQIYSAVEKEDVGFILVNSSFYVELEMLYGASRILTLKNAHLGKGYKEYGGVIITRADRKDIRYYSDLKGKTFMTLDEQAFASWPAVWFELKEHGVDPYTDFASLKFRSPMDAVVLAVRDGEVDAGSIRTDLLERMEIEGTIRLEDFYVLHHREHEEDIKLMPFLHSTPNYPEWPLAKTKDTPDALAEKVADALLEITPDSEAAKAARITGWTIPLNYQPVHEVLKTLRIGPYKDYGKITPMEMFRQYWLWFLGIIGILSLFFAAYLIKINQRLKLAVVEQKKEITERESVENELMKYRDHLESLVEKRTEELKSSQEKLLSSERLAVLGKLSGGVAHEMRNPLGVIDSSAYYLKKKLKDADEKTTTHLDRIIGQVKNSTSIIQSLQSLTKMKEPQKTRVDMAKVAEHGIGITNIPKTVKVVRKLPKDKFFADADKNQLLIVFKNILANAVQAMDDKGTIWVTVNRTSDKWVEALFKDSGHGIKAENQEKIFQSFFGTKAKGFGFGLTICQMIIEKHGGEINVQSEAGKGATFIVRLPLIETFNRS